MTTIALCRHMSPPPPAALWWPSGDHVGRAATSFAYKHIPPDVIGPAVQLLGYVKWVALVICFAWLIVSAGRLWFAYKAAPGDSFGDAVHGLLASLVGAIVCSAASAIAAAILPT